MQGGRRTIYWRIGMGMGLIPIVIGIFHMTWVQGSIGPQDAHALTLSSHSILEILRLSATAGQLPLYYLILSFFSNLFGTEALMTLRWASLTGVLAMVGLGLGPVSKIFGQRTGIIYSWLWVVFALIFPGGEMMPWSSLFITGGILYIFIFYAQSRKVDIFVGGILMLAGCLTHGLAAFVLGILWIYLCLRRREGEENQRRYALWILGAVMLVSGVLLWALKLHIDIHLFGEIKPIDILESMIYPVSIKFPSFPFYGLSALKVGAVVFWGHRCVRQAGDGAQWAFRFFGRMLGITWVVVTIVYGLAGPVLGKNPYLPLAGLVILLLAYGISHLRGFRLKIFACLILVIGLLPVLIDLKEQREYREYQSIYEYLQSRIETDDVFVHVDNETLLVLAHYFPRHQQILFTVESKWLPAKSTVLSCNATVFTKNDCLKFDRRVWLVRSIKSDNLYAYGKASIILGGWAWNAKLFKANRGRPSITMELIEPDTIYRR